jgi:hypothetical protein
LNWSFREVVEMADDGQFDYSDYFNFTFDFNDTTDYNDTFDYNYTFNYEYSDLNFSNPEYSEV